MTFQDFSYNDPASSGFFAVPTAEEFQENRLPLTDRTIEKTEHNVCVKASYFDRLKLQEIIWLRRVIE